MASKLAAAKIAAWSGVRAVIAAADVPDVLADALAGRAGRHRRSRRAPSGSRAASSGSRSRAASAGRIVVDDGARRALVRAATARCSPPACASVEGAFDADDAVEIVGDDGALFAKGLVPLLGRGAARGRGPQDRRPRRRPARTRSSTATTSSCCPDRRCRSAPGAVRHRGRLPRPALLRTRGRAFRHTPASRTRRRPAGESPRARASTVGEEREEGETGSPRPLRPSAARRGWRATRPHPSRRHPTLAVRARRSSTRAVEMASDYTAPR